MARVQVLRASLAGAPDGSFFTPGMMRPQDPKNALIVWPHETRWQSLRRFGYCPHGQFHDTEEVCVPEAVQLCLRLRGLSAGALRVRDSSPAVFLGLSKTRCIRLAPALFLFLALVLFLLMAPALFPEGPLEPLFLLPPAPSSLRRLYSFSVVTPPHDVLLALQCAHAY